MLALARCFALSVLPSISIWAAPPRAQPLRVIAALGDSPVFESEHPFAFLQAREGIRLVSRTPAPPATILLPANELDELPPVGVLTWPGRQTPTADQTPAEFCTTPFFVETGCEAWLGRAVGRRSLLARLVSRRFELRGASKYLETLSTNAARQLTEGDSALRPRGRPLLRLRGPAVSSSGFDLLIPWEALPPQSSLRMESVSLQIVRAGGASTLSFAVRLAAPRHYVFSPCHLPLVAVIGEYPFQAWPKAFYLPQLNNELNVVYAWKDPADTYDWSQLALTLHRQQATYIKVGEGEWICGPVLTHRRTAAASSIGKSGMGRNRRWPVDKTGVDGFQIVRLPDPSDGFVALTPPRVHSFKPFGVGGACAATTVVSWRLNQILPTAGATVGDRRTASSLWRSVRLRCDEEEPKDYEVEFSADLLTVTEYEGYQQTRFSEDLVWRTRPIWWRDGKYKEGLWEDSPPPVSSMWQRSPH